MTETVSAKTLKSQKYINVFLSFFKFVYFRNHDLPSVHSLMKESNKYESQGQEKKKGLAALIHGRKIHNHVAEKFVFLFPASWTDVII